MKLETAIKQLVEFTYGKDKHQDKVAMITAVMTKMSGGLTTVSDSKYNELIELAKTLKSMGMK